MKFTVRFFFVRNTAHRACKEEKEVRKCETVVNGPKAQRLEVQGL